MQLQQIKYILAIAETGNISKAAEKMYVSQSALSQQLLKLEREIGVPLFLRLGRNLEITEAGRIYVNTAIAMLNIEKSYQQEERKHAQRGEVTRIAVMKEVPAMVADNLIARVCRMKNTVRAEVCCMNHVTLADMHQILLRGKSDVIIGPDIASGDIAVRSIAGVAECFCFIYYGKTDGQNGIPAWLSPVNTARRKLEEQALAANGVTVNIVGSSEVPLVHTLRRNTIGIFVAKSQLGKRIASDKIFAEFTQDFTAQCLVRE